MKKTTKFLLALGSIVSLTTLPLIAAKCGGTKEESKSETTTTNEEVTVDTIAKNLKDILVVTSDVKTKDGLDKLKKDSSKYTLWYDRKIERIVMVEGTNPPFGKKFDGEKWGIFDLNDKGSTIKSPYQLVNAKEPIFKGTSLSTRLDFTLDAKKETITIEYKVGKFLGKDNDPDVSKESNKSTISIK
ncbi:variable surface lipoprotein [Metamycoplasma auris]|uniref:Lipoprotein n=1 Tax=Metamycoplasma auris TaxID=51363 RepID=A0A2W7G1J9_9BACT|nr:variable surface lipoprotein [Metamycoplasma auris]PZV99823.1 hypothetical protein BCF89_1076 [Metamycoplasma auris]